MKAILPLFHFYRLFVSPAFQLAFGIRCRYEVTCSKYMETAMCEHGILRGAVLGLKRILTCAKWRAHG